MQKTTPIQKCVIYARVSSREQEREGYSIPAQLKFLNEYAEQNGFIVEKEFVDNETAKKAGRTNFNSMLKFLHKNKKIRTILVEKTDRLYRNFKDYVLLDEFEGIEVHLVKESTVLSDSSRSHEKFIHGIKVLMAKNYIDNLSEEVKKGMLQKAQQGEFPGRTPYGYTRLSAKEVVLNKEQAEFVKRAFELYGGGFLSIESVKEQLFEEGYIYKNNQPKAYRSTIEKILKNIFYTGSFIFHDILYKGKHPAIVSDELFKSVKKAFKKDNKPDCMGKHNFLFSGLMTCPKCGSSIVGQIKKGKYIYYACSDKTKNCPNKKIYVREEEIEKVFIEGIKKIQITSEQKEAFIEGGLKGAYKDEQAYYDEQITICKTNAEKLRERINRLYVDKLDGNITDEFWKEKHNEWNFELSCITRKMELHQKANKDYMELGVKLLELAENLYLRYSSYSVEEKKKILKIIFQNFYLDGGNAGYIYKKPFNYIVEGASCLKWWRLGDSNS